MRKKSVDPKFTVTTYTLLIMALISVPFIPTFLFGAGIFNRTDSTGGDPPVSHPVDATVGYWAEPENITYNKWYTLPAPRDSGYYAIINGSGPVLIEIENTPCYSYLDFEFYSTRDYAIHGDPPIYSKHIEDYTTHKYIFIQKKNTTHYLRVMFGASTGCFPFNNAEFIAYGGIGTLEPGKLYNAVLSSDKKTPYYFQLRKNYRYRVHFTQSENKTMQFEFCYYENNTIGSYFYRTLLYNNGEFTAKTDALALLMLSSYTYGTYSFDFVIDIVYIPEEESTNPFTYAAIYGIGALIAGYIIYKIWEIRKAGVHGD